MHIPPFSSELHLGTGLYSKCMQQLTKDNASFNYSHTCTTFADNNSRLGITSTGLPRTSEGTNVGFCRQTSFTRTSDTLRLTSSLYVVLKRYTKTVDVHVILFKHKTKIFRKHVDCNVGLYSHSDERSNPVNSSSPSKRVFLSLSVYTCVHKIESATL